MEDQLSLWEDVDEMGTDVEGGSEEMGVRLEIFIATAIVIAVAFLHIALFKIFIFIIIRILIDILFQINIKAT